MSSDLQLRAAILVVSDTASQDPTTDKVIPVLQKVFAENGGGRWNADETRIVADNVLDIQRIVTQWTDAESPVNLVVTSGGTGFAQKDVTPEAVLPLIHKHASGLVHTMLSVSLAVTPFAAMARPVAGVRNRSLIVTLPGSPKGAKENLEAIIKLLPHGCQQAFGADTRALHAGGMQKLEQEAGVHAQSTTTTGSTTHAHSHSHDHSHSHSHSHGHGHGHTGPKAHTTPETRPLSNDPHAGPTRRNRTSPYPMLSVEDALTQIATHTPPPRIATHPVNESLVGLVLAADVTASEAVPAFRASIVDGYAVVATANGSTKGVFPVVGISHAQASGEEGGSETLVAGQIARITTGAPLPLGATAVVMVEDTVLRTASEDGREEREVEILTGEITKGENVREVGSDVQAGEVILRKGEGVTAVGGEFGLLASVGVKEVEVYRKPVVGVLSTGDEIVQHDRPGSLRLGEVRDTNRPTLLTAIWGTGFETVDLGIASDKPGALEETLRDAMRKVDVIVTSGGVSMGELDLLKPTIERSLGGTIHFGRVSMKPGKPTTFATVPFKENSGADVSKVIFSLPGNPASAVVTYHLFVLASLHQMSGISPVGLPKVKVALDHDVKMDPQRPEYHRVVVTAKSDGLLHAVSTGFQRSSRIGSFKSANALLCMPAKKGALAKGEKVDALLMGRIVSDF